MVLVCHSYEFVFLKTRKTAGTSAEMFLEPFCSMSRQPLRETRRASIGPTGIIGTRLIPEKDRRPIDAVWHNHMAASDVRRRLGERIWSRYKKVANIRNPFDRAVSNYYFRIRRGLLKPQSDLNETRRQFCDFVTSNAFTNDMDVVFAGKQFALDHMIRFEHLQDDLNGLAHKLGLDVSQTELPITKYTKPDWLADVPEHFSDESTNRVRDHCAWMIEYGGYDASPVPSEAYNAHLGQN